MSKWLSDEWFDETRALWVDQPERPGLSARIQYEITGGPEGGFSYYWVIEDGRLGRSGPAPIQHPDVTLTFTWDDARAVQRGARSQRGLHAGPDEGGRIDGRDDALLPVTNTAEYRDLRRRIAAVTEF